MNEFAIHDSSGVFYHSVYTPVQKPSKMKMKIATPPTPSLPGTFLFQRSAAATALAVCLLTSLASLSAQTAQPAKKEIPAEEAGAKKPAKKEIPVEETDAKNSVVVLNPFTVQSDGAGYMISNLASASHMNVAINNIPADISIISTAFTKDIGAFDLRNALAYTPGVTARINTWDGATIYSFTTVLSYVNGVSSAASGNQTYTSDMAFIDRVEIIKGPAAAIGGTSAAAGYINKVTKMPVEKEFLETSLTLASYNYLRFALDSGGTIFKDSNQSVYYRLAASHTDGEGFRRNMVYKKTVFYPAVTWKLGKQTSITGQAIVMDSKVPTDLGSVYYPGGEVTLQPGSVKPVFDTKHAYWIDQRFDQNDPGQGLTERPLDVFVDAVHSFNDHISIRNVVNYRSVYQFIDRNSGINSPAINGSVPNGIVRQSVMYIDPNTGYLMLATSRLATQTQARILNNQFDINFDYVLGPVHTRTSAGFVYTKAEYTVKTKTVSRAPQNLLAAADDQAILPTPLGPWAGIVKNQYDPAQAYAVNHQSYLFNDRLILTAGGRWDLGYTLNATNLLTGVKTVRPATASIFSKLGGVTVKPLPWMSVWGVYSMVGAPTQYALLYVNAPIDAPGNRLLAYQPTTLNRSWGIKAELLKDRLSATLTHFDVVAQNTTITAAVSGVPGNGQTYILPGDSSIGWELSFNGQVSNNFEIVGGFMYNRTRTSLGKQFRGVPLHKVQAYGKYSLPGFEKQRWNVRLGVQSESDMWGFSGAGLDFNTFRFPGATQWDVATGFTARGLDFDLSIQNLTDVVFPLYPAAVYSTTIAPARTWIATVTKKW